MYYLYLCIDSVISFSLSRMKDATNTSWSFRDFMEKCVVHQYDTRGIPGMNEHFRPQFASGAFCDIRYNFVGELPNISLVHVCQILYTIGWFIEFEFGIFRNL